MRKNKVFVKKCVYRQKNLSFVKKVGQKSVFRQTSIFWSKIEISTKNRYFDRKSKFLTKIAMLIENWNFDQNESQKLSFDLGFFTKSSIFSKKTTTIIFLHYFII